MNIKIEIGMTVYGIPYGNAKRYIKESYVSGTVKKVGRKYAYIDFSYWEAKWAYRECDRLQSRRPDIADTDDENSSFRVFVSEEECKSFVEAVDDCRELREYFSGLSNETIVESASSSGIRLVHDLMNYILRTDAEPSFASTLLNISKGADKSGQAAMLNGVLEEEIFWPSEARDFLDGVDNAWLAKADDARKDEAAIAAFVQEYINVRYAHDTDSGANEAWSKEECLNEALETCSALDKYR